MATMSKHWDFRTILDVHPEWDRQCVAINVRTSKRCGIKGFTGKNNLNRAGVILDTMDRTSSLIICRTYLKELAFSMMCGHPHRVMMNVQEDRVRRWNETISLYATEIEYSEEVDTQLEEEMDAESTDDTVADGLEIFHVNNEPVAEAGVQEEESSQDHFFLAGSQTVRLESETGHDSIKGKEIATNPEAEIEMQTNDNLDHHSGITPSSSEPAPTSSPELPKQPEPENMNEDAAESHLTMHQYGLPSPPNSIPQPNQPKRQYDFHLPQSPPETPTKIQGSNKNETSITPPTPEDDSPAPLEIEVQETKFAGMMDTAGGASRVDEYRDGSVAKEASLKADSEVDAAGIAGSVVFRSEEHTVRKLDFGSGSNHRTFDEDLATRNHFQSSTKEEGGKEEEEVETKNEKYGKEVRQSEQRVGVESGELLNEEEEDVTNSDAVSLLTEKDDTPDNFGSEYFPSPLITPQETPSHSPILTEFPAPEYPPPTSNFQPSINTNTNTNSKLDSQTISSNTPTDKTTSYPASNTKSLPTSENTTTIVEIFPEPTPPPTKTSSSSSAMKEVEVETERESESYGHVLIDSTERRYPRRFSERPSQPQQSLIPTRPTAPIGEGGLYNMNFFANEEVTASKLNIESPLPAPQQTRTLRSETARKGKGKELEVVGEEIQWENDRGGIVKKRRPRALRESLQEAWGNVWTKPRLRSLKSRGD